ncbi:putative autophagy-related protein 23-like, partial [Homarus americanus]
MKAGVVRVVEGLVGEAQDLYYSIQDPRNPTITPDELTASRLVEVLREIRTVVHHRLYFSPTIQYLYASQLARHASRTSASGESLGVLEARVTAAQREREDSVTTRDSLVTSLTNHLHHLDHSGTHAVLSC